MNKNEKYIKKLEENRALALQYITKAIDSNSDSLSLDIDNIISMILLKDGDNDKKSNTALCNAREFIKSMINEIRNANSEEDIINARKRLNYYINKVKSIMKRKEIDEENVTLYSNMIKELRNNIGEYLRLIKRNENMVSFKELFNKEELTEEEKKLLNNYYERERRFNTRLLKKYNPEYNKVTKNETLKKEENTDTVSTSPLIKPKNLDITENATSLLKSGKEVEISKSLVGNEAIITEPVKKERSSRIKEMIEESKKANKQPINLEPINVEDNENGMVLVKTSGPLPVDSSVDFTFEKDPQTKKDFITPEELLRSDFSRYKLVKVNPYGNGFVKDLGALFKNIPVYFANKRTLKIMIRDFNCYCSSESLLNLINFTVYENSFKNALKKVFNSKRTKELNDEEMDSIRNLVYNDSNGLDSFSLLKKI